VRASTTRGRGHRMAARRQRDGLGRGGAVMGQRGDEAFGQCVLPNGKPRAGAAPGLHRLATAARAGSHPAQEVEQRQRNGRCGGHQALAARGALRRARIQAPSRLSASSSTASFLQKAKRTRNRPSALFS